MRSDPGVRYAESELCRADSGQCSVHPELCTVLHLPASLQFQEARDVPEGGGENHRDDVHSTGECGQNISETFTGKIRIKDIIRIFSYKFLTE